MATVEQTIGFLLWAMLAGIGVVIFAAGVGVGAWLF